MPLTKKELINPNTKSLISKFYYIMVLAGLPKTLNCITA